MPPGLKSCNRDRGRPPGLRPSPTIVGMDDDWGKFRGGIEECLGRALMGLVAFISFGKLKRSILKTSSVGESA
jgi:hypothetical protein